MTMSRARLAATLPNRERSARRTPSSAALITSSMAVPTAPVLTSTINHPVPTAAWRRCGSSSAAATPTRPDTMTVRTNAALQTPLRSSAVAPGSRRGNIGM